MGQVSLLSEPSTAPGDTDSERGHRKVAFFIGGQDGRRALRLDAGRG